MRRVDEHSHPPDEKVVRRGLILKNMMTKGLDNPTVPVRRIYDTTVDVDSGHSEDLPSFESVRTRVKRYRAHFIPPIPTEIDDVLINGSWAHTWKGQRFLAHLDNNWGIALFTTNTLLRAMKDAETLYIDGTFRTAPGPYLQFVTVHGLCHGHVIPLAFCLMTGKTTGQYRQLLQRLKQEVRRVRHRALRPRRVVIDFERSLMTAIETELPRSRISGCYFHFSQSLWRNLQQLGLSAHYRRERQLQRLVRKVMALGFLPVLLVRQNFILLRGSRRTRRLIGRHQELEDWLDYVQDTYMSNNATFPPPVWNVYGRDMNTRTNNHLEGKIFNKKLSSFTCCYVVIELFATPVFRNKYFVS